MAFGPSAMDASSILIQESSAEDIAQAAGACREAFSRWRGYSICERSEIIAKIWREIQAKSGEFARIIHEETGKPAAEVETMEMPALDAVVSYFTANARRILGDEPAPRPWFLGNKRAYVRYNPRGVVGIVSPWNMPLLIPWGDAVPALLAGNAVLLKPSERASRAALRLERLVDAAGLLPKGLFSVVTGGERAGQEVVRASDMVVFTGSPENGRRVAAACAQSLKPAVLELGGKQAMIVLRDAPLKRAIRAAIWSGFSNCGQICTGAGRIFVEDEIYEAFSSGLLAELKELQEKSKADFGRLTPPLYARVIREVLEEAAGSGGQVFGGELLDEDSGLVRPAVILEAEPGMRAMTEEIFGPVMALARVKSGAEAAALINRGRFGLAASVWSRNLKQAEKLGAALEAGLVGINETLIHYAVPSLPFAGIKSSGLGRRHSEEGLRQFCWPQSVVVHEWPRDASDAWYFPSAPWKTRLLSLLGRGLRPW
ncbi:MAG TPA: aldehyde dehydrogenase family protein [Elusimicrobiota bacterium]|nr:aldehyde dehydrogenase family protein [Elusimicrobiota bacterium]